MYDDHAYSEPWHSHKSLFKHFQEYLNILRNIDGYSTTPTGAQLEGRDEASPALYEKWINVLILERKAPIAPIFGLNFQFKM